MSKYNEEIKAGVIIVTGLVLIALFVILTGGAKFYDKYDVYYVKLMDTAGINEGSAVRLGGLKVGRIKEMRAPTKPNEPVTVVLGLNKGTMLFNGTRAKISQIGFVGEIYLDLSLGNTTDTKILPGSVVPSEKVAVLSDLISKLDTAAVSLDTLIKDMDLFFGEKNRQHIENLLLNSNKVAVDLNSKFSDFSQSLTQSSKEMHNVLRNMDDILIANKEGITETIKAIRVMVTSMDKTSRSILKTSDSLNSTVLEQNENLTALLDSMKNTMDDLQDTLQEIKTKPWVITHSQKGRGGEK
ncbi:MlaD family protein [Candidatus Magnetomonas plexicatena]|uniref:MlaD family protein n=1 Tax=Candidatus Magnetomonas plexicatena TaxID=2552947 RepID=UPI001C73FACB|nr:MCE family protein [Nitrospirales bacterium LBB_01]